MDPTEPGPAKAACPDAPGDARVEVQTFSVKATHFLGRSVPILVQNEFGYFSPLEKALEAS